MEPIKHTHTAAQVDRTKIINLEKGKLPPQAIDLEEAVLGALLIDKKAADECLMVLKTPDVFYKDAHKHIFTAIQALYEAGSPIDLLTVSAKLKSMGLLEQAGGDFHIIQLSQKVSSSAHIEYHSRIILQKWINRSVIKYCSEIISDAYNEETDSIDLMQTWGAGLDTITETAFTGRRNKSYADGLMEVRSKIEFLTHKDAEEVTGAHTGFTNVDLFTGGWQEGELIILAARPGMGKTSVMLSAVMANAKKGMAVGVISAEMSEYQLTARTIAMDTHFHLRQLTKTGFEKPEYFVGLDKAIGNMKHYPIHIDDTGHPDISVVQAQARLWKRVHNIKLLVVDYLQLIGDKGHKGNREGEISSISRKLKGLAKELKIPVIALSQLSRAVETRGSSKRPLLSDLRESGAIEQDADAVLFIYRPEYYGFLPEDSMDHELIEAGADTELIFAKYRAGAPNTVLGLKWVGDKTKYYDPTEYTRQQEDAAEYARAMQSKPLPTPSANEAFGTPVQKNNGPGPNGEAF